MHPDPPAESNPCSVPKHATNPSESNLLKKNISHDVVLFALHALTLFTTFDAETPREVVERIRTVPFGEDAERSDAS